MLAPTIIDIIDDPELFGRWFREPATWIAWLACLAAIFNLPMSSEMAAIFEACTGRAAAALEPTTEVWLCCGRRAGKSFVLALIAVYIAVFVDCTARLVPGEAGVVLVMAADRRQARVIFRYARALLRIPLLANLVEAETAETISLANGIEIEISTASYRTVRGYTLLGALCDEIAFWSVEGSTNPDTEIITALRPGLATTGGLLLCASSPYARRGALWNAYRRHFGKDGPVLVWKAPTRVMNSTVPQSLVDEALEIDRAAAASEWLAEFRSDVEGYLTQEMVDSVTVVGRHELPRVPGATYDAFVDPSGGSSDSMVLAIGHREGRFDEAGRGVLDVVREVRPPFSPDRVVEEFARVCAAYGIREVEGDRYGGAWPAERFSAHGIQYLPAERSKSDLYKEFLPLVNSGRCELLDLPKLRAQLCSLERRTGRGTGKDIIDHPPGATSYDDVANAVAGVLTRVAGALDGLAVWVALGRA